MRGEIEELVAVGRPAQHAVEVGIVGQLLSGSASERLDVDVLYGFIEVTDAVKAINRSGDAVGLHGITRLGGEAGGEGDHRTVRRPNRRAVDALGEVGELKGFAASDRQQVDLARAAAVGKEGDARPVGRPCWRCIPAGALGSGGAFLRYAD